MNTIKFKKQFITFILALTCCLSFGQNFEGWITYKLEALNPNPEMIPDSTWQKGIKEQFGERGYILQKYFYKKDKYVSQMEIGTQKGFQAFNPKDKLLYSWGMNSDTAVTVDSKMYLDAFKEILESDKTETILGIPCKSVIVKSNMGEMTLWYNPNYFKMDAVLFKGHKYGHWEEILKKIGCLPLKMEQKGFMAHTVQTILEYKVETLDDALFTIPKFKELIKNPMN
ncbi:hypothetical protein [Flavobacterium soli]|uniref:hypothetical protein n=1 Tax=Flavobacterium soli TaxID=344881 RepID=UPI0004291CF2|nr:hypothetical protein [Flavobacterium soli]